MSVRVVAGEFRGRTIDAPKGEHTRPTIDRVREALMSSLYSLMGGFEGKSVLDAFAGSGALGIEALSRGAAHVDFYDTDKDALRVIEANIKRCGLTRDKVRVCKADVMKAFGEDGYADQSVYNGGYDLVFLDPPYALGPEATIDLVMRMHECGALNYDAVIAYEYAQKDAEAVKQAASALEIMGAKKYGKTGVALLRMAERSAS